MGLSIRRVLNRSSLSAADAIAIAVIPSVLVLLAIGAYSSIKGTEVDLGEQLAPSQIEAIAYNIDEEAEGLSDDTLLKSVYTENRGLLDDGSTLDVSFNDPETKALTAKRLISASAGHRPEVSGTVGSYTITYTGERLEYSYDSTTDKITSKETD